MDGKLFSNSIIFCCKWLTLVRSNHALVNKRSDFFLTGVAFYFKCIIVGHFVTGFKVTATPLQRAVNSFFQIFQPINVGGPAGFLINGNRSEATTKPKWSQEKAQWQHPGGKRSAAVLLPVLLVQYASHHFPPVRSRTYLVTYNTSIYFISTRTETLLLAYSNWRKRTRAVLENAQLQRENGKWAKLETSPCLQTYFFCYSNLNRAKPKNLLLKEPIRWACRL